MRRPLLAFAVALVLAGCGGGETLTPAPETVVGTVPQETLPEGNAEAGREVFLSGAQPPCANCHTFAAAGSNQTLGPNLDETLQGQDAQQILQNIVNPDATVSQGFPDNLMPEDYGQKLSQQQLADLVAFLLPKS